MGFRTLASRREVALTDLRTRQILITPRADNPYLESRLQADIIRAGIPRTHIEEAGRYDELARGGSITALIASLRSIVGSLDIDDKLT
ncbi:hypothetical protein [Streptomyces sp. NPDC056669]|uniref:hypothetical protein n=1 Tax=Streptomyces sp. NPDC056669 TaxID=3345903 RepID=UPI0036A4562B